jgi:hypothetical protein
MLRRTLDCPNVLLSCGDVLMRVVERGVVVLVPLTVY